MAINASKYKRSISCRYCGKKDTQSNTVPNTCDGARAQTKADSGQVLNYMENYALQRWQKNQEIATARSNRTTTQKARKCGFCGSEGHNRRHCGELKAVKQRLHDANKIWRRFWAKSAVDYGFAPASLIKITMESWYAQRNLGASSFISLVGNEMPENLNTLLWLTITICVKRSDTLPVKIYKPSARTLCKIIIQTDSIYSGYGWSSIERVEVLGKSNYAYPQEWIEAYPKDIDYAVKKWNKQKLLLPSQVENLSLCCPFT